MKKKMLLMMLLCACLCMLTFTAMAATEGDWEYTVVDETAIVKSYTGSDTIIVVPSTLGGYPVIKLDHACFSDNTNLTAITIPNTVTSLGAYCFSGCSSLTEITIPESVTVLEQFCFLQCPSLKSVSLPEGVQKIETGCFTECKSLAKLLIPKSVTYIGAININGKYLLAFDRSATTLLVYLASAGHEYAVKFWVPFELLDWPPQTSSPEIGTSIFDGEDSYEVIGSGQVCYTGGNHNNASVVIPAAINHNGSSLKVTSIADNAFKGNKKLTTVTLGKNVKIIGKNAFASCAKLTTVKGGAAVTTIKDGAFSGCKALKTFPAMNKLQKIGNNSFKGDKALAKFTLAKTVTNIGKNAFNGCSGLKTITVKAEKLTNKSVGTGAFKGISSSATFKCPKKQLKAYKKLFVKKGAPKTCKFK